MHAVCREIEFVRVLCIRGGGGRPLCRVKIGLSMMRRCAWNLKSPSIDVAERMLCVSARHLLSNWNT